MKDEYVYIFSIISALPTMLVGLLAWVAKRAINSMDKKRENDTIYFRELRDGRNKLLLQIALVEKDVAVLAEKFKEVDTVKKDINQLGGKLRDIEIR